MSEIATYLRIVDLAPTDEYVSKRTSAIKDLSSRFLKSSTVNDLFKVANNLVCACDVDAQMPEALSAMSEVAIQKYSEAFVGEGKELEMLVCGLLAALQTLDRKRLAGVPTTSAKDIVAIGLWLGLSNQVPRNQEKLEDLRSTVLNRAREQVLAAGTRTRQREKVPDLALDKLADLTEASFKTVAEEGLKPTIVALRGNAAIDREEIDLLWWVLAGWSGLLDRSFDHKGSASAMALAVGLEAGQKMRGFPVEAHRQLLLRFVKGTAKLSLTELIVTVASDRDKLASLYPSNAIVAACPEVFPLISALVSGEVAASPNAERKHSLVDWANRALLESTALHLVANLPRVSV